MPAGRPTDLTPQMIEDVKRILPTVMYLECVGDYLGVHRTTWRLWLRRGRKEFDRLAKNDRAKPKEKEALYLEFFYACKKALAEGEIYDAGVIKKAAAEAWQAAAWRLERRFPDRWGRRDRVEHSGDPKHPVKVDAKVEPVLPAPEAFASFLEDVAAVRRGDEPHPGAVPPDGG